MSNIRQERPNKGPILKIRKRNYLQTVNKTFSTHVEKSMVSASFLKIKLLAENLCGG